MKNYTRLNYLKNFIKYNSLSGNKSNNFKINLNESEEHRNTKYKVCTELIKKGFEVFTEVDFKKGGRADIVCFDNKGNGIIFEIVNSELESSKNNKLNIYPIDFEVYFINCKKEIELAI